MIYLTNNNGINRSLDKAFQKITIKYKQRGLDFLIYIDKT